MAQLVERLLCKQDVAGSNPAASTNSGLKPRAWSLELEDRSRQGLEAPSFKLKAEAGL